MGLELKLSDEKNYSNLLNFLEYGDELIDENYKIISQLKSQEYIQYVPTTFHSISALIEGKSKSTNFEHYVWTPKGELKLKKLIKKYNN